MDLVAAALIGLAVPAAKSSGLSHGEAALIGAAIGAGGAVAAQIIASVVAQKSANARFAWEQAEAQHGRDAERAARFLDVKREQCMCRLARLSP